MQAERPLEYNPFIRVQFWPACGVLVRTSAILSLACFAAACGRTGLDHTSVVASGLDAAGAPDVGAVADDARITVADSAAQPPDSRSCQWTFAPQVLYPAAWKPWSLVVGDFNGDGIPDVVAGSSDETDNSVAVWINNGDGRFAVPVSYALTSDSPHGSAWTIAAGDFNGDHQLDLAVVGNTSGTGGILFGQGDGSFTPAVPFVLSYAGADDIAVGDLDGDAKPDLAVALGNSMFGVFFNLGDGFSQEFTHNGDGGPWTLAIADFDGDGHLDLAIATSPRSVNVLFNNGDGSFALPVILPMGRVDAPNVVVAGDFNDDGHPDLACTAFEGRSVAVWLNRGDGSFAPEVDYITGSWPTGLAVADFDGDGRTDFAVANSDPYSSSVSVFLNAGDGTFSPQVTYAIGGGANAIAAADFNGDGRPDLAVANGDDHTLGILLSECR